MPVLSTPRRRTVLAAAGVCALLLTGCGNGGNGTAPEATDTSSATASPSPSPAAARIVIQDFAYSPANLRVSPGTRITVENRDSATHTVTAAEGKAFDTGTIAAGATATFTAPQQSGSYSYTCTIHPNMQGILTVR